MQGYYAVGRVVSDPELTYLASGKACCSFSIAVRDAFRKDEEGKPHTNFFNCVCWGQTAETVTEHFHKGKEIGVRGELHQRRWKDEATGKGRSAIEVNVGQVWFIGPKPDGGQGRKDPSEGAAEEYSDPDA